MGISGESFPGHALSGSKRRRNLQHPPGQPGFKQQVPRDKWELGNNSFLLHGFYQYKHLLLLRRETEDYIGYYLGVPGIYNEREQMLASMFGFEEFRLMKGQETVTVASATGVEDPAVRNGE